MIWKDFLALLIFLILHQCEENKELKLCQQQALCSISILGYNIVLTRKAAKCFLLIKDMGKLSLPLLLSFSRKISAGSLDE